MIVQAVMFVQTPIVMLNGSNLVLHARNAKRFFLFFLFLQSEKMT